MDIDIDGTAGTVLLANKDRARICVFTDFWRLKILSQYDKLVFVTLKSYATLDENLDYTKYPFPGIDKIREDIGLALQTIIKALDHLEELGFIKRIPHQKGQPGHRSTLYVLNDSAQMCSAKTAEEAKQISQMSEEEYYANLLRKKGWKVEPPQGAEEVKEETLETKEKELPSAATDESSKMSSRDNNNSDNSQEKNTTSEIQNQYQFQFPTYTYEEMLDSYGYSVLIHDYPNYADLINEVMDGLYELHVDLNPTSTIDGKTLPRKYIIDKLKKLNHYIIIDAINSYVAQTKQESIKNTHAYLLTCVWRNISGHASKIEAQYNSDSYL